MATARLATRTLTGMTGACIAVATVLKYRSFFTILFIALASSSKKSLTEETLLAINLLISAGVDNEELVPFDSVPSAAEEAAEAALPSLMIVSIIEENSFLDLRIASADFWVMRAIPPMEGLEEDASTASSSSLSLIFFAADSSEEVSESAAEEPAEAAEEAEADAEDAVADEEERTDNPLGSRSLGSKSKVSI